MLEASGLETIAMFKKGHPRVPGGTALSRSSGFNVDVSNADGVLEQQARDAVRFMKKHARGLDRMRKCREFGGMTLDFGIYYSASSAVPWPSHRLPMPLIKLAARHAAEIELSFYGLDGQ